MKNILKYTLILSMALYSTACNLGEFDEDVTKNPDAVTLPFASSLLTNSMRSLPGTITATTGSIWVQYLAESQYQDGDDNYDTKQFDFAGWYAGPLADLERIIVLNEDASTKDDVLAFGLNENQIAISKILQSYYYLHLTDRWGMIPYSTALGALKGSNELPVFDTQETVYNGLFQTLKDANAMMIGDSDEDLAKGDILFGGDLTRWKIFANTIRLTMALRLSEVNESLAKSEFASALAAGVVSNDGDVDLDIDGDIFYQMLGDPNNENAWYSRFRTRKDWCISNTLVDYMQIDTYTDPHTGNKGTMNVVKDPRLSSFAEPTGSSPISAPEYVGMVYGIGTAGAADILNANVSFLGQDMRIQNAQIPIYTKAQILFARAEAAQRGWTTETAATLYVDAIQASFDQYGKGSAALYLTNSAVAYNAGTALEQIMTQKWVANYLNGYEAWADWRRTGFPNLSPAPDAQNVNDGYVIPVRQAYGNNTIDLNGANYAAAVAIQGADELGTPVWWDK